MKTTLIVDGYNAINAIPPLRKKIKKSLESARKAILQKAKEYARSSGFITDVRVVFDGDDRYRFLDASGVPREKSQVFSETGGGDEKIIELVKRYTRSSRVIVASNDNYVRNNARAYGASPIFAEELVRKKNKKQLSGKISGKKIDKALQEEITREYKKELGL